jgi:hypothetical protein
VRHEAVFSSTFPLDEVHNQLQRLHVIVLASPLSLYAVGVHHLIRILGSDVNKTQDISAGYFLVNPFHSPLPF